MKKTLVLLTLVTSLLLTACGNSPENSQNASQSATSAQDTTSAQETTSDEDTTIAEETTSTEEPATEHATAPQQEVGFEGMTAVYADALNPGDYDISVDSSSSMFKIAGCVLHVTDSDMTADIIIDSKSYDLLFMGSEEEADKSAGIPYSVNDAGQSVFTVPVEALDQEILCAALSAKKQEWYGRTLVFRADSLPDSAFRESKYVTAQALGLADGEYTAEVTLGGGSGKASVQSPAKITVTGGQAFAEIIWSSNKYDYMTVDGEKILPDSTEEFSVFTIPVKGFGSPLNVTADTTAMSQPHEIDYTLTFDQESLK
jgi:hypothetical protein